MRLREELKNLENLGHLWITPCYGYMACLDGVLYRIFHILDSKEAHVGNSCNKSLLPPILLTLLPSVFMRSLCSDRL